MPACIQTARVFLALVGGVLPLLAAAQEIGVTAPALSVTPRAVRDATPPPASQPPDLRGAFFEFGPVSLHPRLSHRSAYGLRLPAQGGRFVASMIDTSTFGLSADLGSQLTLDLARTRTDYSARALPDSDGYSFNLEAVGELGPIQLALTESYSKSNRLLIETGQPTPQRNWNTGLAGTWTLGRALTLQATGGLDETYGELTPDVRDWSGMAWFLLHPNATTQLGLGLGGGYTEVVRQPDATNERLMGRFNWVPTDKLSVSVDGGYEFRRTRALASRELRNPILQASINYQPFDVTTLSLTGAQAVSQSYFFENQANETASFGLDLRQRLLGHFYLNLGYTRGTNDYIGTTDILPVVVPDPEPDPDVDPADEPIFESPPGRSDRTRTFRARLSTTLLSRWSVAISFQRTKNGSNLDRFNFTTTQYALDVGLQF